MCAYVSVCTYIHICACTYIHICMDTQTYIHTYGSTCKYAHTHALGSHMCIYIYIYIYIYHRYAVDISIQAHTTCQHVQRLLYLPPSPYIWIYESESQHHVRPKPLFFGRCVSTNRDAIMCTQTVLGHMQQASNRASYQTATGVTAIRNEASKLTSLQRLHCSRCCIHVQT